MATNSDKLSPFTAASTSEDTFDDDASQLYSQLAPITVSTRHTKPTFWNWAQTYVCTPLSIFEPDSTEQCDRIVELARREGKTVRAVGVGHSPSDLPCTTGFMIRITRMNKVLEVNREKNYVVVQPGIILSDLHSVLEENGLAMMNVGSISDQTLGGCITTATHGSGLTFQSISSHVLSFMLLTADGSHIRCSRTENHDIFAATLCGFGTTGIILSVQLQVERYFNLREDAELVTFDSMLRNFEGIVDSAEHVRMWWFNQNDTVRVSRCNRTSEALKPGHSWFWGDFMGHDIVQFLLFLGRFFLFINTWTACFASWLLSTPSVAVDVSHKIFNVDCRYRQYTTEWAVPLEHAPAVLQELRDWLKKEQNDPKGIRPHFPVEIRLSEEDDLWLSPAYGQRVCWIGVVAYKPYNFNVPYRRFFAGYEAILTKNQGRPHWAKAHGFGPSTLRSLYPRFDDFVHTLEDIDPQGMFRNEYVRRHIFGETGRDVEARIFKKSS